MEEYDDDSGTIFRDMILLALLGFVAMVLMLLPFIKPGVEAAADPKTTTPGNVMIEMTWDLKMDADVDLWVRAPGDVPVGYSNKGSAYVNLLRDDLGKYDDLTDLNYEVSYSRGIVAGEWVVNIHAFRIDPELPPPIKVTVAVDVQRPSDSRSLQIIQRDVTLERVGQELTVVRFRLTKDGDLVPESVNNLQVPLVLNADG